MPLHHTLRSEEFQLAMSPDAGASRGIAMIGPLVVRTILGIKDVTRRVEARGSKTSPYGTRGDRLYVRETHRVSNVRRYTHVNVYTVEYRADGRKIAAKIPVSDVKAIEQAERAAAHGQYRPPMFCARWASRVLLEVKSADLEPLHDITINEVRREGLGTDLGFNMPVEDPLEYFATGWTEINGGRGYPWDKNPTVWRVEYKVHAVRDMRPSYVGFTAAA